MAEVEEVAERDRAGYEDLFPLTQGLYRKCPHCGHQAVLVHSIMKPWFDICPWCFKVIDGRRNHHPNP